MTQPAVRLRGLAVALSIWVASAGAGATTGRAVETLIFAQPAGAITLDEVQRARLLETLDKIRGTWCQADIVSLGYVAGPDQQPDAPLPRIGIQRLASVYTMLRRQGVHDSLIYVEKKFSRAEVASVWIELVGNDDPACRGRAQVFQDSLPPLGEPYRPWK